MATSYNHNVHYIVKKLEVRVYTTQWMIMELRLMVLTLEPEILMFRAHISTAQVDGPFAP
jgi:hypothetical protein